MPRVLTRLRSSGLRSGKQKLLESSVRACQGSHRQRTQKGFESQLGLSAPWREPEAPGGRQGVAATAENRAPASARSLPSFVAPRLGDLDRCRQAWPLPLLCPLHPRDLKLATSPDLKCPACSLGAAIPACDTKSQRLLRIPGAAHTALSRHGNIIALAPTRKSSHRALMPRSRISLCVGLRTCRRLPRKSCTVSEFLQGSWLPQLSGWTAQEGHVPVLRL
ncbi:uncharacterized protein LOC121134053 [Mesocricetus auratus]|uniref:Uncharacterized protein LOC121134053 n=1 Tax=Mesocricetus auratus TaxID=10036 RepID=A0ABM2W9V8_MESAU|nr:uncharacterized protein LOC121134053 [Mesocricetus auratus]